MKCLGNWLACAPGATLPQGGAMLPSPQVQPKESQERVLQVQCTNSVFNP